MVSTAVTDYNTKLGTATANYKAAVAGGDTAGASKWAREIQKLQSMLPRELGGGTIYAAGLQEALERAVGAGLQGYASAEEARAAFGLQPGAPMPVVPYMGKFYPQWQVDWEPEPIERPARGIQAPPIQPFVVEPPATEEAWTQFYAQYGLEEAPSVAFENLQPGQSTIWTPEFAADYGIDLEEGYNLEVTLAPETDLGYTLTTITPEGWRISEDTYTSPEGEVYTLEQMQEIWAKYEEIEAAVGEAFPDTDIQEVIEYVKTDPEGFLTDIAELGRMPETEILLEQVGYTERQMAQLFGETWIADFPDLPEEALEAVRENASDFPVQFAYQMRIMGRDRAEPLLVALGWDERKMDELFTPGLWQQTQGAFMAGIGDVYHSAGSAILWGLGDWSTARGFGQDSQAFGEHLRTSYIPPVDPQEFSARQVTNPEWWATSVTRALPFTLSLIPAAIVGAYGGVAVAGALGLGTFGTVVAGSLGAAALSRPLESAFEAGNAYDEALRQGMSEEEATAAANYTFTRNLTLVGMDAGQFILAFAPIPGGGGAVGRTFLRRIGATTFRVGVVGVTEAGEEAYQDVIIRRALGEDVAWDPQMKEAVAIGAIFGMGLGGAGSVYDTLIRKVTQDMPADVRADFERFKTEGEEAGLTPDQAELEALDRIAETPRGAESIRNSIEDLKAKAAEVEPKEPAVEPMRFEIPPSQPIIDSIMVDNWMRTVVQKVAKVPLVGKVIEAGLGKRILVKRQSEAIEDIMGRGRFLHHEVNRRGEGARALVYWRLFEVSPDPVRLFGFNEDAISETIPRLTKEADGTIEDIFMHPKHYGLNAKQEEYVRKGREIEKQITATLVAEGVAPEVVSEGYWKRIVIGKFDPEGELIKVRGRPGVRRGRIGARKSFEMHRKAPTMAEGIAWGIKYGRNPADSVTAYLEEAISKIADARFIEYIGKELEPLGKAGKLPREELLRRYPELVEVAVLRADELANANSFVDVINRAIRGEKIPTATMKAIDRRFPELGRKFRALVGLPTKTEAELGNYLREAWAQIKDLQARKVPAALPVIPDEQKLREAFEVMAYDDRLTYRAVLGEQRGELQRMIGEQAEEVKGIAEFLKTDPVASYRGAWGKRKAHLTALLTPEGRWPETLTQNQARLLLMGAEIKPTVLTKEGRVRWEYVTDQLADHFGMSEAEFIKHLEYVAEQRVRTADLKTLTEDTRARAKGIERILGVFDAVDTEPEFIPKAEPGMPEAGLQEDMFGFQQPVVPKGKGKVTQISMDDYAKLVKAWEDAGLPESALPIAIKPKVEGISGMEAETEVVQVSYEIPEPKSPQERKAALEELRKEVQVLSEAARVPYWEAREERAFRMEQMRQPGIGEGYIMQPFAGGRLFDQDYIDAFNKFFGQETGLSWLRMTADTAGLMRILKAALDFSQPAIQGQLSWGLAHSYLLTNPKIGVRMVGAWYATFFEQIGAFFNPGIMARFMERNKDAATQRIAMGGSSRAVFFFEEMQAVVGKGKIARWGEEALRKIPLTPYQRAEVAFFTGGEIVRDRYWRILSPEAIKNGAEFELARYLDLITGIADPRAMGVPMTIRQLEQSFIFFSSAYTRSYLTVAAEIFRGGYTGAQARRAVAGLAVAGAAFYVGIQYAISTLMGADDDEAWEDVRKGFGIVIDPITGEWSWRPTAAFLSMKIGDTYFGIGGGFYGLMRLGGNILATINEVGEREIIDLVRIMKHGSLNKRDNPFIAWWYNRSSALTGAAYEMVAGRDFLGYPIETPGEYGRYIISLLEPIWVEQSINPLIPGMVGDREVPEDALETAAWIVGELFGLRVNPEYAWQRFYNVANEYIPRIPEDELDERQKEAWREGTLGWGQLTDIQKVNLLYRYPDLYEAYEEAQADSEIRALPHWKQWTDRQDGERTTYYERGDNLVERVIRGEEDTRWLREQWADAGQNYGVALDMIEKEPAYTAIYDFFNRQREEGDKYLFEADMALAEYIQIMFADYTDWKGDMDWDARDRAINTFIEKWGEDWYVVIREMYAQKRLLDDMNPVLVRMAADKDVLGRGYWQIPYDPDNPEPGREAREAWRREHPEDDARLALWGYGGKVKTMAAYDLLSQWGRELGIPIEQMGLGLPPRSLVSDYFAYGEIPFPFSGWERDRFLQEHPDFFEWGQETYEWKDINFSEIPTRAVERLWNDYSGLEIGTPRLALRCGNPDLDEWLVRVKGYTPCYGTDRCEGIAPPEAPPAEGVPEEIPEFEFEPPVWQGAPQTKAPTGGEPLVAAAAGPEDREQQWEAS